MKESQVKISIATMRASELKPKHPMNDIWLQQQLHAKQRRESNICAPEHIWQSENNANAFDVLNSGGISLSAVISEREIQKLSLYTNILVEYIQWQRIKCIANFESFYFTQKKPSETCDKINMNWAIHDIGRVNCIRLSQSFEQTIPFIETYAARNGNSVDTCRAHLFAERSHSKQCLGFVVTCMCDRRYETCII